MKTAANIVLTFRAASIPMATAQLGCSISTMN
jgi:hypothetical protein